ncbi:MAG TPA: LuxR C-terminal-related transcriptional regulator [Ktedonobacterales bacterium]
MTGDLTLQSGAGDGALHLAAPQRTDDRRDHHKRPLLAAQLTPLIDRVAELETIRKRLADEQVRLLTLTGPAGVGKTRLALEAAAQMTGRFPDGVVLVDLAPVREPQRVLPAIADALGCSLSGGAPLLERLTQCLAGRALLIVLDNFEQVLSAATDLADLLTPSPDLKLVVTSRVPLQLRFEHILKLAPLPVPRLAALPSLDELLHVPAVAFFVARARARQADFAVAERQARMVAELVVHLDGLPLALELAAAHLDTLPLASVLARLGNRMHLLHWEAADVPARQRSLEAAVGWSYDLLNEDEQRLFRAMGVFAGPVSLDAITGVARAMATRAGQAASKGLEMEEPSEGDAAQTLERLVSLCEHSLILPLQSVDLGWESGGQQLTEDEPDAVADADPAFGMLETMREYAQERLVEEGELEAARWAHAHAFLALAERARPQLRGRGQCRWLFRLEREHDNLRAALRWLLDREDDPAERSAGLRMTRELGYFWWLHGYHREGAIWLEEALARAPFENGSDAAGTRVRTMALCWAGALLTMRGEFSQARTRLEEACRRATLSHDAAATATALTFLGQCAVYGGETEQAQSVPLLREAVRAAHAVGAPHAVGFALFFLGLATYAQGNATEAAAHYAEALGLCDAAGDERLAGAAHIELGVIAGQHGDMPTALSHLRAALGASGRQHDRWLVSLATRAALVVLGARCDAIGQARLAGAAEALRQATGGGRVPWEPTEEDGSKATLHPGPTRDEWESAYREGRSLSPKEAIQLALRLLDEMAVEAATAPGHGTAAPKTPPATEAHRVGISLSARELEVLRLVAQGETNKAIAKQLYISPSTVNYHLISIFNKLTVDTRAQAVAVAGKLGLI